MNKNWNELNRAMKKSKDNLGLHIFKPDDDDISLVIDGIDNKYEQSVGGTANWEIYLNKDGTWKIT